MKAHLAGLAPREARWHQVSAEDALADVLAQRHSPSMTDPGADASHAFHSAATRMFRVLRGIRYGVLLSVAIWAGILTLLYLIQRAG